MGGSAAAALGKKLRIKKSISRKNKKRKGRKKKKMGKANANSWEKGKKDAAKESERRRGGKGETGKNVLCVT